MTSGDSSDQLPQVLLPRKPAITTLFGEEIFMSDKFDLLKAYESALPLHQFLTTHAHKIQAIWSNPATPITADILRLLPHLKLVITTTAGLDFVDLAECRCCGVAVANAGTVYSEDVADMAVGLLIDVLRNISAANRYVKQRLWPPKGEFPLASKDVINFLISPTCLNSKGHSFA
ncbi:hypothetical protein Dsin_026257 [Dipteronia sinensis]|uniref:D-isomer specific 2-hydroxyacid dehydrogenase catalytic domain-containing protein n=1 Tax=Dipteronia sinensis TaxID=43782 RepID=A0AAD9ZXA3_9ROSI|nr:hypothetical protein Dsin_026257 [Dipteronia sinensis]